MTTFLAFTADRLGRRHTRPCGCSVRRIPWPVGGAHPAYEVGDACPEHEVVA